MSKSTNGEIRKAVPAHAKAKRPEARNPHSIDSTRALAPRHEYAARPAYSSRNAAPTIAVGNSAPRASHSGEIPSGKYRERID